MNEESVEEVWRVTWFPPDKEQLSVQGTEAKVRTIADREAEWNPIIERRQIIRTAWELAENSFDRGASPGSIR